MAVAMMRLAGLVALTSLVACAPTPVPMPILESTTATSVTDGGDDPRVVAADALTTPAHGAAEPLVVVTVFTDFQCPDCPRVEAFMEMIRQAWPEDVQVQYRHFPLSSHALAASAGAAAAAAHRQGGYACVARGLYDTQEAWSSGTEATLREHVHGLAEICHLDADRLVADIDDPLVTEHIEDDFRLGREVGVRGTPWVLVNGVRANLSPRDGLQPATLLKALVRRELRESRLQMALGKARAEIPAGRLFGNLGDTALADRLLDR
jgi:protein-disulfide isomerase